VISQTLLKRNGGGRIAAHEIMIGTPAIRNLIREGKIAQMYSAIQTGQARACRPSTSACRARCKKASSAGRSAYKAQNKDALCKTLNGVRAKPANLGAARAGWSSSMDRDQAIKLMQDLLRRVEKKGSDLFITAGFPPAIKIDGEIRPQSRSPDPEQSPAWCARS
jgi:Tfp pilus assembly pilus retraction ATPase PilT